jgi:glycosyltransferase involved in cell wall biosynthesis
MPEENASSLIRDWISMHTKSKKKIVMIGPGLNGNGGISSVVSTYKQAGMFDRLEMSYLPTNSGGTVPNKLRTVLGSFFKFTALAIKKDALLLHVHAASRNSFYRKSLFILTAITIGVPYILHLHGGEFKVFYTKECGPLKRKFVSFIFARSAHVIALSDGWKQWLEDTLGLNNVVRIYNPVVIPTNALGTERTINNRLLFLGRISRSKGVYDLLEAVSILVKRHPRLTLLLGGDGEIDQAVTTAKSIGIEQNMNLLGWVSGAEKERHLSESSVFVLPSYNEGLPMGALEAMAYGLPVIATPVGGIPEAISSGESGILVDPGDVTALAEAIESLLGDQEKRTAMGKAARSTAEKIFSADIILDQIADLYTRAVK